MGSFSLYDDDADFRTLNDIFEFATTEYAQNIAYRMRRDDGKFEEYSYARFRGMSCALANYLSSLGAGNGTHIGLLSENRPEWPIIYFAILRAGAVVVPMDALLSESEITHIVKDAEVSILFASRPQFEKLSEMGNLLRGLKQLIVIDPVASDNRRVLNLQDALLQGEKKGDTQFTPVKKDDLAALIYTSGTTGVSKGVMLSHGNITSDVLGLRRLIWFDKSDSFLSVLPMHHTFEATTGMIIPISKGSSVTVAESLASKRIIANIRDAKVTIIMGVPLLYEKMLAGIFRGIHEKPLPVQLLFKGMYGLVRGVKKFSGQSIGQSVFRSLRNKAGLGSLRYLISGGAPLPVWVGKGFAHLGIHFLNGYGLTEASPVLAVNVESDTDNTTVGYPVYGAELSIDEPDQQGIGELRARGDMVMQGYYKNKKATDAVLRNGWLYTGDIARFDAKGRVVICGRSKDVIVTEGGKNIYPEEIEMLLDTSIYIRESLVLGRPISKDNPGENVVACIVPDYEAIEAQYGTKLEAAAIEELISGEITALGSDLPAYKKIREFVIHSEEFPKTSTRKIKRYLFKGITMK
ncbi:MAG: AMP-binding protein [Spirochaetota bacterium]|jgi:long-chain acyl-CoA synthetase|nr:AMP-binding protein [Spirochaetota bacterium]